MGGSAPHGRTPTAFMLAPVVPGHDQALTPSLADTCRQARRARHGRTRRQRPTISTACVPLAPGNSASGALAHDWELAVVKNLLKEVQTFYCTPSDVAPWKHAAHACQCFGKATRINPKRSCASPSPPPKIAARPGLCPRTPTQSHIVPPVAAQQQTSAQAILQLQDERKEHQVIHDSRGS